MILLAFNVISWLFSDASPVGGNRCHFGPALWCQSRVHAKVKKEAGNIFNNM